MCRFVYTRQYLAQTTPASNLDEQKKQAFRVDETHAFSPGTVLVIIPIFQIAILRGVFITFLRKCVFCVSETPTLDGWSAHVSPCRPVLARVGLCWPFSTDATELAQAPAIISQK